MKILLSVLFYVFMAGTTATVGTGLENKTPEKDSEIKPVENATNKLHKPAAIKTDVKHGFKAFGVKGSGNKLVATWAAESAQIAHFLLEYSVDGKLFQPVVQINYSGTAAYKYNGANEAKLGYYRVASIKKEGTTEYSALKKMRTAR